MNRISVILLAILFLTPATWSQKADSTTAKKDTVRAFTDSLQKSLILKPKTPLKYPTMPLLPSPKNNKRTIHFDIGSHYRATHPEEATNWDASNLPDRQTNYPIPTENVPLLIPITPLNNSQPIIFQPLPMKDYLIPTRAELDILEILWVKEDVQDTTIYSCLDTTLNITMEDLNELLETVTKKKLVRRKIVSPRCEFNLFGVMIEVSPSNIRNRVYEYHSNVNRDLMRTFIDANSYLFSEDSSIINRKLFEAVRKDTSLLNDLNDKMYRVNK